MILKKLTLQNIRSYENQEIQFPQGSILLSGDIGSGKTSVLLAIEFALFGLQPSQRGHSLLRNGKREARVVLELELDGKNVVIERTLKKSSKTISQDYSSISIDNEKTEASVTEIKNKVLQLLNYPFEFAKKTNLLYKFTVYTPQEEMKQIILESADTRLNTLRHVFGIDKYKRIEENIKIFTTKLREEIRNKEGQLADIEQIRTNLQDKTARLQELKTNLEKENKTLEERRTERQEIEQQVLEVEGKIKEKENFEKEKEKSSLALENKEELSRDLDNQIKKLERDLLEGKKIIFDEKNLQEIIRLLEEKKNQEKNYQEQLISLGSKLNSFDSRKQEAEQLKGKITRLQKCPTCLQEVNEQYKAIISGKIEQELSTINYEIVRVKEEKSKISANMEVIRKQLNEIENKKSQLEIDKIKLENLREKQEAFDELQRKKRQTEKDIFIFNEQIKTLQSSIEEFSKFLPIFEQKNKELQKKILEEKNQEIKVAEFNKEISMTQESVEEIQKTIKEKEELKKKVDYLRTLNSWLVNKFLELILFTEKNVMLKLREEFSKLFTEWFSVLVPETLSARLAEDFTPIIEQQGYEIDYAYLSGGERTAVALSYRLALNQVINSLLSKIKTHDLVILDEPTDGFSESQLDKMRDVLSQLKVAQLILVSHEAKIESFVENIIKFKKEAGITRVET